MAIREETSEQQKMTRKSGLRIAELKIKQFKGLELVAFALNGNLIQITGKNGAGKTSVLDMLWYLFVGQAMLPKKKGSVVRNGAESAEGRVWVRGEEREFTITRKISRDGVQGALDISPASARNVNGKVLTPQQFLDDLLG